MKKILIPLFLVAAAFPSRACINSETRELRDGTRLYEDLASESGVPQGHRFEELNFAATMARLNAGWRRTGDDAYRSDMGVLLILQKKYSEARDLYLDLERRKPGRYSTASNLGTVYELMGRNDSALHWIRRAVAINPRSHEGSEWIHVAILRAKVAGNTNPSTTDLLGTGFGNAAMPRSDWKQARLWDLRRALYYQLQERMSFIPPPDPVIARLLFELGNIHWMLNDPYNVEQLYGSAARYGFADTLLERRRTHFAHLRRAASGYDTGGAAPVAPHTAVLQDSSHRADRAEQKARYHRGLFWAIGGGFVLLIAFVGMLYLRRSR